MRISCFLVLKSLGRARKGSIRRRYPYKCRLCLLCTSSYTPLRENTRDIERSKSPLVRCIRDVLRRNRYGLRGENVLVAGRSRRGKIGIAGHVDVKYPFLKKL